MNNSSIDNNDNVTPYKASGNLNTMLNNPSANINNTMNVNIQNTNIQPVNNNVDISNKNIETISTSNTADTNNKTINEINTNSHPNNMQEQKEPVSKQNLANVSSGTNVNRTFVNTEPQKTKKTVKIQYSPELKIAIFIVVILLIFLMVIPIIENFIGGLLH